MKGSMLSSRKLRELRDKMKILVLSDSHSALRFMRRCMDAVQPDAPRRNQALRGAPGKGASGLPSPANDFVWLNRPPPFYSTCAPKNLPEVGISCSGRSIFGLFVFGRKCPPRKMSPRPLFLPYPKSPRGIRAASPVVALFPRRCYNFPTPGRKRVKSPREPVAVRRIYARSDPSPRMGKAPLVFRSREGGAGSAEPEYFQGLKEGPFSARAPRGVPRKGPRFPKFCKGDAKP